MTKTNKVIILAVIAFALVIAYWLISPVFIDKRVNEGLGDIIMKDEQKNKEAQMDETNEMSEGMEVEEEPQAELAVVSSGTFIGLEGHEAGGTVKIIESGGEYYVRFEDDFESTNGPDVRVYLGKGGKYDPKTDMGELKGNIGSQNYKISENVDVSEYDAVWLWCRAFTVDFGKADLKTVE